MAAALSGGAMATLASTNSCSRSPASSSRGNDLENVFQQKRRVCVRSATRPLQNSTSLRLSVVCAAGASAKECSVSELNDEIASFYDESSGVWEEIRGEHMHHGYYDGSSSDKDHKQAQIRMIEESLAWAGVPEDDENKPRTVVDVGCGIGGTARHLARKYQANVKAITVHFQVADALMQPFADGEFDLVLSMECGEHIPDKRKFVQEMARVCAPDGRILIVTCCHGDLKPAELSLAPEELDVRSADWSNYVTPYWPAVMASALSLKGLFGLAKAGWTTLKGIFALGLMIQGYKQGIIKLTLITARKIS